MKRLYLGRVDTDYDFGRDLVVGPWCFAGAEIPEEVWRTAVFVEPFDTRDEFVRNSALCADIIRYQVGRLAGRLNARHGVSRGIPFWWTVLTPWLQHLVEATWWYWRIAEMAVERHGHEDVSFDEPAGQSPPFADTGAFVYDGLRSFGLVEMVLARFFDVLAPENWVRLQGRVVKPAERTFIRSELSLVSGPLKRALRKMLPRLPVQNLHGISGTSLPLSLYVALLPRRASSAADFHAEVSATLPEGVPAAYLAALDRLIEETMPASFGAGFACYDAAAAAVRYVPRRLFVTAPTIFEDSNNFLLGHALEAGERVVRMQHGSEYGTAAANNIASMNEYVDAAFLTWGWTAQARAPGRFVPIPAPALSRVRNRHRAKTDKVILVGTVTYLAPIRLSNWQQPSAMYGYRSSKAAFVEALAPEVRPSLVYRPYGRSQSDLPDEEWLIDRVGPLAIHDGPLNPALLGCRLAVLDHPGTTLHFTMAANVPTVSFWPDNLAYVCVDAAPLFARLRSAGIVHSDPVSAAAHVNAIAADVGRWWNAAETQAARRAWVEAYARTRPFWWAHWLAALARI